MTYVYKLADRRRAESVEKEFNEFVAALNRTKMRSLCPRGLLDGCGQSHMQVGSAELHDLMYRFLDEVYESAVAIYEAHPRRIVKNHVVSKTMLGKGVHYKIVDDTLPTSTVSSSSVKFTTNAKFGDVFEIFCSQIETLWGIKRDVFFTSDNLLRAEFLKYYSREYFSVKLVLAFLYAIHKVRARNLYRFLPREEALKEVTHASLESFRSVSWLITHHPQRESNLLVSLAARDITRVSYDVDEGSGLRDSFLIPLGRYGYFETSSDGFGMMGSLFINHNVFTRKGSSLVDPSVRASLMENAELWVGKACSPSGELRVFYLEEGFTYRTAVVDAHSSRTSWMRYDFQIDPKRLSSALGVYERQHIEAGIPTIRKTLSQKHIPKPPSKRELRRRKKRPDS